MKRGQLAAVLVIVLLVAVIGAFVIFSDRQAGEALRMSQYPTLQSYIPPAQGPQYENPPSPIPLVERKEGTTETTEKPKCSYTCSCTSKFIEGKCVLTETKKILSLSGKYPRDKKGVKGESGTDYKGESIFRCTATLPLPAPATMTGMTDEECTETAKQKVCDEWTKKTCLEDFTDCMNYFLDVCIDKAEAAAKAADKDFKVSDAEIQLIPWPPKGKVGSATLAAAK